MTQKNDNLLEAVLDDDVDVVGKLIKQGLDINKPVEPVEDGVTLLHIAANNDQNEIAQLLIDNKADLDAKNADGRTPLHWAVNIKEKVEETESIDETLAMTKLLLGHGASIEEQDNYSLSPIHFSTAQGGIAVAKLLLDHGADINAKDEDGWTPLHFAANENLDDFAEMFIERGADIEAGYIEAESNWKPTRKKGLDGEDVYPFFLIDVDPIWTPLGQAVIMDSVDVAELLIRQGAEVRINNRILDRETGEISYESDAHGWTMLHQAAENNASKVMNLLLSDERIDIQATCTKYPMNGWTPLHVAVQGDQEGHSDLDEDVLGGFDTTTVLIEHGAMMEVENGRGDTPLLHAIRGNSRESVSFLVEKGSDINGRSHKTGDGPTALELASDLKLRDMVAILIKHGAEFG